MTHPAGYLAQLRARRAELECLKARERSEMLRSVYRDHIAKLMREEAKLRLEIADHGERKK